jgi:PEP-CTERM motif
MRNICLSGGVALLLCTNVTFGALLTPGGGVSGVAQPDPVGGVTLTNLTYSFVGPTFSGTISSSVISGDASNPWGGLTFTYQFSNTGGDAISRFTVSPFTGFFTDVSFQGGTALPQIAPNLITRSADGSILRFNFDFPGLNVAPGQSSSLLVVQTDATGYKPTIAGLIDGSTVNLTSFAPVPEPASASLLLLGIGALIALRRKSN